MVILCPNCGVGNQAGTKSCYRCSMNLETAYADWPALVKPQGFSILSEPREENVGFFETRLICSECGGRFRALKDGKCASCYQHWLEKVYLTYIHPRMMESIQRMQENLFGGSLIPKRMK